ncbi:stress response protein nst1 [Gigaspora margarita]|uniref:Stress response protein NST1 n=1 Tax=Gigaspora margarita TaxID=4874 RepID=A0A8H4AMS6_GIGMA|nr:stress response protein nst1 [Gigaspora margarita]
MNIVKEPSGTPLSPTSPPSKDPGELTPSHSTQNKVVDVDIKDEEFFSDDEGYDSETPEIPFPCRDSITNFDGDNHNVPSTPAKKKKKKKNKSALSISQMADIHHPHHNHNHKSRKDGEEERRSLVKEDVIKKMKEQQKHSCSCSVCGRKRTAIEEELETLYDAYYEELELYANQQQQFGSSTIEYRNDSVAEYDEDDVSLNIIIFIRFQISLSLLMLMPYL